MKRLPDTTIPPTIASNGETAVSKHAALIANRTGCFQSQIPDQNGYNRISGGWLMRGSSGGVEPGTAELLVVDDEPTIRGIMTQNLELCGFICRTAEDVSSALKAV